MTSTIVHPGRHGVAERTMFGYVTDTHPRLDGFQNAVSAICGVLAGVASVTIAVLTLTELAARNLFNDPLGWSVGFTEMYLLPIVAFFGAVTAYRSGAHIAVVTVFNKFPPSARKGLILFAHLLVFIGFGALAWGGFSATIFALEVNQTPLPGSALLLIPGWVMESIVPVASTLGAVVVAIDIYRELISDWSSAYTDYEPGDTDMSEFEMDIEREASRSPAPARSYATTAGSGVMK